MKQMSLGESGFERKTMRTRKGEFLDEMNLVMPWAELVSLIALPAPAPGAKGGRPPFAVVTMLRIHFIQQWFNLSDPAMEDVSRPGVVHGSVSWMREPQGRVAGFSSCTALACTHLISWPRQTHFPAECKASGHRLV
jgi:hypothetical protein